MPRRGGASPALQRCCEGLQWRIEARVKCRLHVDLVRDIARLGKYVGDALQLFEDRPRDQRGLAAAGRAARDQSGALGVQPCAALRRGPLIRMRLDPGMRAQIALDEFQDGGLARRIIQAVPIGIVEVDPRLPTRLPIR
ncbi:hypothetical protein G6F31_018761 [Rhizopus arrhizus]|nr:hypothetical protein G6F31_018761 [Rhizopus arrhizus]